MEAGLRFVPRPQGLGASQGSYLQMSAIPHLPLLPAAPTAHPFETDICTYLLRCASRSGYAAYPSAEKCSVPNHVFGFESGVVRSQRQSRDPTAAHGPIAPGTQLRRFPHSRVPAAWSWLALRRRRPVATGPTHKRLVSTFKRHAYCESEKCSECLHLKMRT